MAVDQLTAGYKEHAFAEGQYDKIYSLVWSLICTAKVDKLLYTQLSSIEGHCSEASRHYSSPLEGTVVALRTSDTW